MYTDLWINKFVVIFLSLEARTVRIRNQYSKILFTNSVLCSQTRLQVTQTGIIFIPFD